MSRDTTRDDDADLRELLRNNNDATLPCTNGTKWFQITPKKKRPAATLGNGCSWLTAF